MKVVGNLICQNAVSEIRRCIESVAPLVSEYYVCDGGSTDGTWELLNDWKDVYNLTLFQNEYKDQGAQRNFLLSKTPKDVWVLNIDQDEQINSQMFYSFEEFMDSIPASMYTSPERDLVLTVAISCINLATDLNHYNSDKISVFATKLFYNDRNAHFTDTYHTTICYEDKKNLYTNAVVAPKGWAIKHYAYLDPTRDFSLADRHYDEEEYNPEKWTVRRLPKAWRY